MLARTQRVTIRFENPDVMVIETVLEGKTVESYRAVRS